MLCNGGLGSFFVGKIGDKVFVFQNCSVLVNDAQQFLAGNMAINVKLLDELQCSEHGIAADLVLHSVRLLYSSACAILIMAYSTQGLLGK